MCDTLVVLPNSSADGALLFAKNSDREPNEAHHLQLIPAADHPAGAGLGLAITRGIVDAHEGHVSVENVPHGCRFVMALPVIA